MQSFDEEVDVVVVGSGAAGMTTAWTAARLGLTALVVEKANVFGGNTALSGGGAWLPNAPLFLRDGQRDDPDRIFDYLRAIAPDVAPERHRRYIAEAPRMAAALEATSVFKKGFFWIKGYADYYPELGGNPLGRGLWPTPIDQRALGEEAKTRRGVGNRIPGTPKRMWMTSADFHDLLTLRWGGIRGPLTLFKLGWRSMISTITRSQIVTNGAALATRLRLLLKEEGVPLWLSTPMLSLITEADGRVVGVEVWHESRVARIGARRGVMMAAGGFEGNADMRRRYMPDVRPGLSQGSADNMGDGIRAGQAVGAAVDLMDDAWWMPAFELPTGAASTVAERSYPHQFIVNGAGHRFINECAPYTDFGHAQIEGHRTGVCHLPAFMIIDQYAWDHYFFMGLPGRKFPENWLNSGLVVRADALDELATKIGVPGDQLVATAKRFNAFARRGIDEDFHRGESAYDTWYGNPAYKNPNLGEVKRPPFYAFRLQLSDLGTKGGLRSNENAQVLREDGTVIAGLYTSGNNSAAIMGNSYAGPGATIGPAMTLGWIAAQHMARPNAPVAPEAATPGPELAKDVVTGRSQAHEIGSGARQRT